MALNRRNFLRATLAGAAVAAGSSALLPVAARLLLQKVVRQKRDHVQTAKPS